MTFSHEPFSDDSDRTVDPELLLEIAAWLDGRLPEDRAASLEARLAEDPMARTLAASARLRPVTPSDAAAPVSADLVARATALVPTAAAGAAGATRTAGVEAPIIELTGGPRRFPVFAALRVAGGMAACVGAAAIGWQLGGSAGQPAAASASPVARTVTADGTTDLSDASLLAAATFGVFEGVDDDPLQFLFLVDDAANEGITQ